MTDCYVQLINFPSGKVHEAVTENEDGSFTVFIDKNLTYESQCEKYAHAVRHMERNDFNSDIVQDIETKAHK